MVEDILQEHMSELIRSINAIPAISADGLKDKMFPDDLIASLHNHLGNANQYISSSRAAMNGAEQFMSFESAQKELESVDSDLFKAHQTQLIGDYDYNQLADQTHQLVDLLSDMEDPEYN